MRTDAGTSVFPEEFFEWRAYGRQDCFFGKSNRTDEPRNASDVLALGRDAQRMAGRTDDASILVAPVIDGGVYTGAMAGRIVRR